MLTCSAAAPGWSTSQCTLVTFAGRGISTSRPEAALSSGMSAHSRIRTIACVNHHNRHSVSGRVLGNDSADSNQTKSAAYDELKYNYRQLLLPSHMCTLATASL